MPAGVAQQSNAASGIVWLASYPKSGNTWTRAFLSNLVTIMAGDEDEMDVNSINRFSIGENFVSLYKQILGFEPKYDDHQKVAASRHFIQKWIADQFEGLVFCKTHNALVIDRGYSTTNFEVTSGAIYIVRNPLDVAISLSHHINKSIDEAIDVMGSQDVETPINDTRVHEIWGSWSQHVESWTRKPHPAIYIMRYEDMLDDSVRTFSKLAGHLLLNPTAAELALALERASFVELKKSEARAGFAEKPLHAERFFREGRAGQWRDLLSRAQVDQIVGAHGLQMARFGYLP